MVLLNNWFCTKLARSTYTARSGCSQAEPSQAEQPAAGAIAARQLSAHNTAAAAITAHPRCCKHAMPFIVREQLHIQTAAGPHLVHARRQQLDQRGVLAAALHRVPLRTAEQRGETASQRVLRGALTAAWLGVLCAQQPCTCPTSAEPTWAAAWDTCAQNKHPHLRPVVEAALQLNVVAAVRPHNDRRHQLGLRRPAAAVEGRDTQS